MLKTMLLMLFGYSIAAAAQAPAPVPAPSPAPGYITIYTQPGMWRGAGKALLTAGLASHEEPPTGDLFLDDQKELFFRTGRFVTFRVSPGPHDLATTEKKNNPKTPQLLTVTVEPGQHYFVRMAVNARELWILDFQKHRLEPVSCEVAQKEASKTTPQKHFVQKAAEDIRVNTPKFPTCE